MGDEYLETLHGSILPSYLIESLAVHEILGCKSSFFRILKALLLYLLAPRVVEKSESILILHPLHVNCFSPTLWKLAGSYRYLSVLKF